MQVQSDSPPSRNRLPSSPVSERAISELVSPEIPPLSGTDIEGQVRQPRFPGFGTPRPDAETRQRYDKYIAAQINPESTLDLQVGRQKIIQFRQPPFRVQLANPGIADYLNLSEAEFSFVGQKVGSTVLTLWFRDPAGSGETEILSYLVRVIDDPEESLRRERLLEALQYDINRAFPNSAVQLTYVGSQVVVRGQAKDIEEATQILRIVASSLPGEKGVEVPFDPKEYFVGGVDAETLLEAGGLEGLLKGENTSGINTRQLNRRIVNLLQIAGLHQVMLKVTVAEVNRSAARAIGADLAINGENAGFFSLLPLATLGTPGIGGTFLVNRGDFDLAINALKTLNLARSLAEPNLVTLNGRPANFNVGGSFPIPVVTGATATGIQGVEFQNYGVQLTFIPTVTDGDRIRLNLNAQISTRDESATADVGGTNVPGLNQRMFNTTVELREGQTLAIAGLIQTNFGATSSRVPILGDIPYLGRLFSSDGTSYDEQELIVLVTPQLVAPLEKGVQLAVPGSDMFEPSDCEFFIKGSLTGCRAEDFRSPARTDSHQIRAFHRREQQLIIGSPGHTFGN